jgi:hypothetical protein
LGRNGAKGDRETDANGRAGRADDDDSDSDPGKGALSKKWRANTVCHYYHRDLECSRAANGPAGEALKTTRGFQLPRPGY